MKEIAYAVKTKDPEVEEKVKSVKMVMDEIQRVLNIANTNDGHLVTDETLKQYQTIMKTILETTEKFKIENEMKDEDKEENEEEK